MSDSQEQEITSPSGVMLDDDCTYRAAYMSTKGDYSEYDVYKLEDDAFVYCGHALSRTDEDEEIVARVRLMLGLADLPDVVDVLSEYDPD